MSIYTCYIVFKWFWLMLPFFIKLYSNYDMDTYNLKSQIFTIRLQVSLSKSGLETSLNDLAIVLAKKAIESQLFFFSNFYVVLLLV